MQLLVLSAVQQRRPRVSTYCAVFAAAALASLVQTSDGSRTRYAYDAAAPRSLRALPLNLSTQQGDSATKAASMHAAVRTDASLIGSGASSAGTTRRDFTADSALIMLEEADMKLAAEASMIKTEVLDPMKTVLIDFYTVCHNQGVASAARIQEHDTLIASLADERAESLGLVARRQVELDVISKAEASAQESYDQTVAQRSSKTKSHAEKQAAESEQQEAINKVLTKLEESRAETASSGSNLSSSSSQLDRLIGIFSSMNDTFSKELGEDASTQATDDAQLLTLVNSYKTALQHENTQYQTKQTAYVEAKSSAQNKGDEKDIHQKCTDTERAVRAYHVEMCGTSDPGSTGGELGTFAVWMETTHTAFQNLMTSLSADIHKAMDEERTSVSAGSSFLQVLSTPVHVPKMPELPESWKRLTGVPQHQAATQLVIPHRALPASVADVMNLAKEALTRKPLGSVEAQHLHSSKKYIPHPLKKYAQSKPADLSSQRLPAAHQKPSVLPLRIADEQLGLALHALAEEMPQGNFTEELRVLTTVTHGVQHRGGLEDAEPVDCVAEKQRLTAEIVSIRQNLHASNAQKSEAEARVTAIEGFITKIQETEATRDAAQRDVADNWAPLALSMGGADATLQASLEEIDKHVANLTAYSAEARAPAVAASLPSTAAKVRSDLAEFKAGIRSSFIAMEKMDSKLQAAHTAQQQTLDLEKGTLELEEGSVRSSFANAQTAATSQSHDEQAKMAERDSIEAQCEA